MQTLNRTGYNHGTESPTSRNYYSSQPKQQQQFQYSALSQPQHFHHPEAVSPPPFNHSHESFPPPPPPLSSTISNMQSATSTFRSNPKLTANSIPRPYPGSPSAGSTAVVGGGRVTSPSSPFANNSNYHSFESANIIQQQQQQVQSGNNNLEACVKDLHDKTFGQGGVVQITGGYPGQNYEGYTSR